MIFCLVTVAFPGPQGRIGHPDLTQNIGQNREDYAHQQPSLTKKKLRRLELTAGAPKYAKTARGVWSTNQAIRQAERELATQAEASYKRLVTDQQAGAPARKVGASATPERA